MVPVVIDSNIIRQDLTLEAAFFRRLFAQGVAGQFQLLLPEVVLTECQELFRRVVSEKLGEVDGRLKRLRGLRIDVPAEPDVDIEAAAADFAQRLRDAFTTAGGSVLSLPTVSHDVLVERAARRRKPFSAKGAGYRDALIWQTTLDLAQNNERVILVTDNSGDFAGSDGKTLHEDLRADLENEGLSSDAVVLYRDLQALLAAEGERAEDVRALVAGKLQTAGFIDTLDDRLAKSLVGEELPGNGRAVLRPLAVDDPEGAWIEGLYEVTAEAAEAAYPLGDDRFAVEVRLTALADIAFYLWKGEAYSLERRHELGDEIDLPFRIDDYDYNESFALAGTEATLEVVAQITTGPDGEAIEDFEIVSIEPSDL